MSRVRIVDIDDFRTAARDGKADGLGAFKYATLGATKAAAGEQSFEFIISDGEVDRDFDTISPNGWDLHAFRKSPVVLFGHQHGQPPIAKAFKTRVENGRLLSVAEFTPKEVNPFGHMVFKMVEQGFLKSTSVGFRPLKWAYANREEEPERFERGGINFQRQELLEWSIVPVPANPRALIQAHELGIDTAPLRQWAEEVLDLGQPLRGLARDDVERAWQVVAKRPLVVDLGASRFDPEIEDDDELAEIEAMFARLRSGNPEIEDLEDDIVEDVEDDLPALAANDDPEIPDAQANELVRSLLHFGRQRVRDALGTN